MRASRRRAAQYLGGSIWQAAQKRRERASPRLSCGENFGEEANLPILLARILARAGIMSSALEAHRQRPCPHRS